MKKLFLSLCSAFIALNLSAQIEIQVEMGTEKFVFKGHEIFNGNDSENTYYLIEDGVFHYHYTNYYEGKPITYIHAQCEVKALDLKSVMYVEYPEGGMFMYIKTRKMNGEVTKLEVTDSELTGVSTAESITKEESTENNMEMIINSKDLGSELVNLLKKGK